MSGTVITKRYRLKRGERNVTDEGLALFEAERIARRPIYNGIIDALLHQKYGDRVCHIMGYGWVLRPDAASKFRARLAAGPKLSLPKGFGPASRCIQHPCVPISKAEYDVVAAFALELGSDVVLLDGKPMTFGTSGDECRMWPLTDEFLRPRRD